MSLYIFLCSLFITKKIASWKDNVGTNSDLNKYGTPMVLMTIPYFTEHTSMEGLYFDSSITTPFHFIAVSGLAERPSNPVGGLSYINNEFEKGVDYLNHLGVDYFISYTDSITDKANSNKNLNFLFTSEPFSVFKIQSDKIQLVNAYAKSGKWIDIPPGKDVLVAPTVKGPAYKSYGFKEGQTVYLIAIFRTSKAS